MQNDDGRMQSGEKRLRISFCTLHSALCVLLTGCSALPAVSVRPQGDTASLRESFDRAFVSRTSDFGEDQVVLVNAPIDRRTPDHPGKLIQPLPEPPLHTVMAIRLHWRAKSATLSTDAGLNAVLHWYVYGSPAGGGPPSLLHYVGTGFVIIDDAGDGADVTVTHGMLALSERYGDLRDPLGAFTLNGSFHAVTSASQLTETLADVKAAGAQAAAAHPVATQPAATQPTTRP